MKFINGLVLIGLFFSPLGQAEIIGQWMLDGTLEDSSAYSHDGESFNTISSLEADDSWGETYSDESVDGVSQSYLFSDENYIALDMYMSEEGELGAFSVSLWFNSEFSSDADATSVWAENWAFLDFDRSEYFSVFLTGDGRISFSTTMVDSDGVSTSNDLTSVVSGLNDGEWHYLTVSYGEVYGKQIYIDDALDSVTSYVGDVGTGTVRYGYIGEGSESDSYNGNRNDFYYDGLLSYVTLRDNEVYMNSSGEFINLEVASSLSDVPAPLMLSGLLFLCLGLSRRKC